MCILEMSWVMVDADEVDGMRVEERNNIKKTDAEERCTMNLALSVAWVLAFVSLVMNCQSSVTLHLLFVFS